MEDKDIIRLYYERSEKAVEEMSNAYSGLIRSVIRNILKNEDDVLECEQDIYMLTWQRIPPDDPDSLPAYLTKMARNKAIDAYRYTMRKKRASFVRVIDDFEEACSGKLPDEMMEKEELIRAVNAFLSTRSKAERVVFVRYFYFGHSPGKIAYENGISSVSVRIKLLRLKRGLKEYLLKEGLI